MEKKEKTKERMWIFPLEKEDFDRIDKDGDTNKVFYFPLEYDAPYLVMVGKKKVLEELKNSQGVKSGMEAGWNFLPIDIDNELEKIRSAKWGDDVPNWHFPELNLKIAVLKKEICDRMEKEKLSRSPPMPKEQGFPGKVS